MRALYMIRCLLVVFTITLFVGCTKHDSTAKILDLGNNLKKVVVSDYVGTNWDKVCFFGPYSNNELAKSSLGFDWDLEINSSVYVNEGVSLLVLVKNSQVIDHFEIKRRQADFANFTGNCFDKTSAIFVFQEGQFVLFENV